MLNAQALGVPPKKAKTDIMCTEQENGNSRKYVFLFFHETPDLLIK